MQADKWTHRLGNLVLTKGNSILGRKPISEKIKDESSSYYYQHDSSTSCEKLISKFTDGSTWKEKEILAREIDMINFALERWSIPCVQDSGVLDLPQEFFEHLPKAENIIVDIKDGVDIQEAPDVDVDDIVFD